MRYSVKTTKTFDKEIKKLDKHTQKLIISYLFKNLQGSENPRAYGKGLTGDLKGLWRYRVSDYRILCEIRDNELIVIAIEVGNRKDIYK